MDKSRTLIVVLCLLVVLVGVGFWLSRPFETRMLEAQVKVDDVVGLNLDTDKLYFGTVMPGGSARRSIIVGSPRASLAVISIVGPESSLFVAEKNSVFIEAGENESVGFGVSIPQNLPKGNYSAVIEVDLYRAFMKHVFT